MSNFVTNIPVDLSAVKSLLPPGSHVEGVVWNPDANQLELKWSNPDLVTPYTFHFPFHAQHLKEQTLPHGASRRVKVAEKSATCKSCGQTFYKPEEIDFINRQFGSCFGCVLPVPTPTKKTIARKGVSSGKQ